MKMSQLPNRPLNALSMLAVVIGWFAPDVAFGSSNDVEDVSSQHVIVVVGAGGTAEYQKEFVLWAAQWKKAALDGGATIKVIQEESKLKKSAGGLADGTSPGRSLRDFLIEEVVRSAKTKTDEAVWIVLLGHGTYDGRVARFNLPGPDVSASQLATSLGNANRPVVVINCGSCSAPFVNLLSGPNRIVVTATKSGQESQYCRFGRYISKAIGSLDADLDRDGQTSLREAWLEAAADTKAFYDSEGRLATEHSLLDDNADQKGSAASSYQDGRLRDDLKAPEKVDGDLAGRLHLVRSPEEQLLSAKQRQRRDELEQQLRELRKQKSDLKAEEYLNRLEQILLPLSKLYEEAKMPKSEAAGA